MTLSSTQNSPTDSLAGDAADVLIDDHIASQVSAPGTVSGIGFSELPSVVVKSAEGVTLYAGAEDDPGNETGKWLDEQISKFGGEQNKLFATADEPDTTER
ncbi:MAG TPA: hypothetical protein VGM78_06335 [Ilumatobacteraceae bacterium]